MITLLTCRRVPGLPPPYFSVMWCKGKAWGRGYPIYGIHGYMYKFIRMFIDSEKNIYTEGCLYSVEWNGGMERWNGIVEWWNTGTVE